MEEHKYEGGLALHFVFMVLLDESFGSVRRGQQGQTVTDMEDAYSRWIASYRAPLSRYLGSIRNIVRFISSATVDTEGFSIELLRSQLSDEEQRLLLYVSALDESMRPALYFFVEHNFGSALADKDSFSYDLSQLVSFRLNGSFF